MDAGSPFTHTMRSPLGDSTTAVTFFETGSKGAKREDFEGGEHILGVRVVFECLQKCLIDGVETFLLSGCGQAGYEHKLGRFNALDRVRLA